MAAFENPFQASKSRKMQELMYMLQNNPDESKKGEWEVALLEIYGAERGNPDVQEQRDFGFRRLWV